MDYYQIIATVSLVIQIVVLVMLLGGYWLKRLKKLRQHGIIMLAAVVLHSVMILAWMIPSFRTFIGDPGSINLANPIVLTILVHSFIGIGADLLGIWLVASWRLRADLRTCFAKKTIMRVTLVLWLIALALGFILYLIIVQLI